MFFKTELKENMMISVFFFLSRWIGLKKMDLNNNLNPFKFNLILLNPLNNYYLLFNYPKFPCGAVRCQTFSLASEQYKSP